MSLVLEDAAAAEGGVEGPPFDGSLYLTVFNSAGVAVDEVLLVAKNAEVVGAGVPPLMAVALVAGKNEIEVGDSVAWGLGAG